mgnify:CR=1 FL=1
MTKYLEFGGKIELIVDGGASEKGIESTVIVNESEISPDEVIEKEPTVSSEKLKLWLDKENEDVGVGAAGAELPPPPPQEAKVSAVRLAKSKDDFPLS